MNKLVERYAYAYFNLALENDALTKYRQEALDFSEKIDAETLNFLNSQAFNKQEKKDVFSNIIDGDLYRLFKVIVDNKRTAYLKDILNGFVKLADEELGILNVRVVSAKALSAEEITSIKEALAQKYHKDIVLKQELDEGLIAGMRVYIGEKVIDTSTKTKVSKLREQLLEGIG